LGAVHLRAWIEHSVIYMQILIVYHKLTNDQCSLMHVVKNTKN